MLVECEPQGKGEETLAGITKWVLHEHALQRAIAFARDFDDCVLSKQVSAANVIYNLYVVLATSELRLAIDAAGQDVTRSAGS